MVRYRDTAGDGGHALELAGQCLERGGGHEVGLVRPAAVMVTARVPPPGSIMAARPASVICRGTPGIRHSFKVRPASSVERLDLVGDQAAQDAAGRSGWRRPR
jgi:hypothetical protein